MSKIHFLKSQLSSRRLSSALLMLTALTGVSCGNYPKMRANQLPASYSNESAYFNSSLPLDGSTGTQQEGDYTCPLQPNVLPNWESTSGEGEFRVCTHRTSSALILLHGKTRSNGKVCVFPAQKVDSQHLYFKPDVATGLPWVQCIDPTSTGITANFPSTTYNAVFVTDEIDKDSMQQCLASASPNACPSYSYGSFR